MSSVSLSVNPLKRLYAGSCSGTFTYLPPSFSAAVPAVPPLPPFSCRQNPAPALR